MSVDCADLIAIVDELLAQFGRTITLLKTPREPANPAEPWKGPAAWDDATAPAGHKLDGIQAVFVGGAADFVGGGEARYADRFQTLIRRGRSGFLVSSSVAADLTKFDRIDDGGQLWKIDAVNVLQPGSTMLLYGIEVSR